MFDRAKFEECMRKSGVTKKSLAKKIGINESTLYRKINGGGDFDRNEMGLIVLALGVQSPMEIFFAE